MDMIKISIIMPVYNDEDRLTKSINSFLNQTLSCAELICVNDGSTDDSLNILNDFAEKFSNIQVFTQDNQGAGKARNYGISKAQGKYIGFLDADDVFIDNHALERLYETAIKNDADMVSGNIKLINSQDDLFPFNALDYYEEYEIIKPEDYGIPWAFNKSIYRSDFLKDNKIEFPDLLRGQDPVFLAEALSKVDAIHTIPVDVYGYYYIDGANQCNTAKKRQDHMMHYRMVFDYLSDSKFGKIRKMFRHEMFAFINMMGVEGGKDILGAARKIFKDDYELLKEFEDTFYYVHRDDELKNLVEFNSNPDKPRISVLIPVYNVSRFLQESIESLLNQTFEDFEMICVNDGSTDDSLEILNKFSKKDSRIKIFNKNNEGCGAARNLALEKASGKYVYFFDPDDVIATNCLEDAYKNAIRNGSDFVIFKFGKFADGQSIEFVSHFNFDDVFQGVNFNKFVFDYHDVKSYVMNSAFAPWCKLYKKSFLDRYDDLCFDVGIAFDDVPFHVKTMLRAEFISFVPEFLYYYNYQNPNSINHTTSKYRDILTIIDIVEKFLKDNGYFEDFIVEFHLFKIAQISYFISHSNSEEYFKLAKDVCSKIDEKYVRLIIPHYQRIYRIILKSNDLNEYKHNIEFLNLENSLKSKINALEIENRKLRKENKKLKELNREITSSNSWKITKPLRTVRNIRK